MNLDIWGGVKMTSREFPVSGFSAISIKWAMDIQIVRSENYSVIIRGTETQLNNMKVSVCGEQLNLSYNLNIVSFFAAPFSKMSATITLPVLRELNLSGASNCLIRGFKSQTDFKLNVTGASRLQLDDISFGKLNFDLSGASIIKGKIESSGIFDLKIIGASKIELEGFAGDMVVDAAGASSLDLGDSRLKT
jgi:hypothetical protein